MSKILKRISAIKKSFFKERLPIFIHKSYFLSSLYYLLFDSSFRREHSSVLSGKVKHIHESKRSKSNYYLLVRNTHRIEKGLIMKPKRAVFGLDYIDETIESFEGVWKAEYLQDNPQMKWFLDVLNEYFTTASIDAHVAKLHERFKLIIHEQSIGDLVKSIPYFRLEENNSTIQFQEFYKLTRQRRSIRWFLDKKVDRELIDNALLAGIQSPSACNRQPFEFRIFDDPSLVKKVVNLPMGTRGYGHTIPVIIVIVGNLDAYFDERDRHVIYIDASLAAMPFMLALETMGLSSCAINWPDIEEKESKMAELLNLSAHQRPIMCMGVGYADPDGLIAFSEKLPLDKVRKYN